MLSTIFKSNDDLELLAQRFIMEPDGCISVNFRKIRGKNTKESEVNK